MQTDAVVFTSPGSVSVAHLDLPQPAVHEVRVRTFLTAISPGTEMLVYRGQLPEGLQADETIASLGGDLAYPISYGYCAVGRVAETGRDVDPAWQDRSVFAFQPHQADFIANPADLISLPDDLDLADAVFLPNMETALGLVMDGGPLPGERVAVIGQGIVGLLTASLLSFYPLEQLVTFDRFALRRRASLAAGAGASLDPDRLDGSLRHRFDRVFELSGAPAALDLAIALAGDEARIVVGSWYGSKRAALDLGGHFHRGRLKLISSQVSRLAPHLTGRWTKARRMDFAVEMVRRLRPSQHITHHFPLARAAEAYRLIDQSPAETIQVVLDYV